MSSPRLDGPRLPPASGGAARQLVVFLHGYGADGNDLIGLGREWARMLPHAAFVSPHAPESCGMAPMGRQWFNLTFRDPGEMTRGLTRNPAPAAIVGYSGALANAEALAERQGDGPAILLVHGDMDEVIPVDAMLLAREQLAQAGLPVEWHVARGLGHGIDPTGLKLGGAFLKQAFAAAGAI
jgi:phospholipase/carboxylesterase